MPDIKPLRFTMEDAMRAHDEWGFNCFPAAACAVLDKTPDEIRPHLGDFEKKRYVNPTLGAAILHGLRVKFRRKYECAVRVDKHDVFRESCNLGLMRLQWGGRWMEDGVPPAARYRFTHWIACRYVSWKGQSDSVVVEIFDINALHLGGWLDYADWNCDILPQLLANVKRGDGTHHPTHVWSIE